MADDKVVKVRLIAVADQYVKGTREASLATQKLGADVDGISDKTKAVAGSTRGATGALKGMAAAGGALAGTALVAFLGDAVSAAGDLEQSVGGVDAVFGSAADKIHDFGKESAENVGLSTNAFNELVTVTGAMLKNKGLEDFADQSVKLVQIGADLSATFGGSAKDAVEALNAAMRGESDPIERYGISLSAAAVDAELLAKGQNKLTGASLEQAKAQARIELIMRQSADATGAFAREADTLQGQQQRLNAEWENAKAELGQALLPVLTDVMSALRGGVDVVVAMAGAFERIPGPVKLFAAALLGFRMLRGPVASFLTGTIEDLRNTRTELDNTTKSVGKTDKALRMLSQATILAGLASVARGLQDAAAAANVADVNVTDLADTLNGLSKGGELKGGLADIFRDEGGLLQAKEQFVGATEAIDRFATVAFDALSDSNYSKVLRFLQPGAESTLDKYISQIDAALAQMVADGNIDQAQAALDSLLSGIDDPQVAEAARQRFVLFAQAIKGGGIEAGKAEPKVDDLASKTDELKKASEEAAEKTQALAKAILAVSDAAVSADQAEAGWQEAIDNATAAIEENGRTATKNRDALNLNTEAGRNNQDALIGLRDAALANAEAMLKQGDETDTVKTKMGQAREEFIKTAEKMGLSKDAAKKLADEYGLTKGSVDDLKTAMDKIPEEVVSEIKAETKAAQGKIAALQRQIDLLQGKTITINVKSGTIRASGVNSTGQFGRGFLEGNYAGGGYTGRGGKFEAAGIVHKGEVVFEQEVVKREGLDKLMALRSGKARIVPGYATGGLVGGFVSRMAPAAAAAIDYDRLISGMRGAGITVNVNGSNPDVAARRVVDALQWEVANGF